MPDKNTEFLAAAMKRIQQRGWEVLAAMIEEKINISIRIPGAVSNKQKSGADQAIQVARDLSADGWNLASFIFNQDSLIVDLRRDKLE